MPPTTPFHPVATLVAVLAAILSLLGAAFGIAHGLDVAAEKRAFAVFQAHYTVPAGAHQIRSEEELKDIVSGKKFKVPGYPDAFLTTDSVTGAVTGKDGCNDMTVTVGSKDIASGDHVFRFTIYTTRVMCSKPRHVMDVASTFTQTLSDWFRVYEAQGDSLYIVPAEKNAFGDEPTALLLTNAA